MESRALELVAPHCDIVERLRCVPPAAAIRGIFFQNVERQLQARGAYERYRSFFPDDRISALPYYPLADYLLRLATAGAIIGSPERVHEGMRLIGRSNAENFASSLLGKALIRLLSSDPARLTEQGLAARRQTHRYGRWTLVRHGPRRLEVIYEDEYVWIESAVAGAAEGTYVGCTQKVHHEHRLRSRFAGSTLHTW